MRVASSTRYRSCTVTVEQNRYGAMTLRSAADRTYQVVGSEGPAIEEALAGLSAGSEVTVRLIRAHGRGNGWYVAAVDTPASARHSDGSPTTSATDCAAADPADPADPAEPPSRRESR